jgi:hypothetical protein
MSLPNAVGLARLSLPAGTHDLIIELRDGAGRKAGEMLLPGVAVSAGGWTFVDQRVW